EADLPPAGRALERLTALAAPRASARAIRLEPRRAAEEPRRRDVAVGPGPQTGPFRLGDKVCFALEADRASHVVLIDVGTSGGVAVLLPNAWRAHAEVAGGRPYLFPGPEFPEFEFVLSGRPGRERVFALATRDPLPVPLAPQDGAAFRA